MKIITLLRTSALLAISALALVHCGGDQKAAEAPPTMPSAEPPTDQSPEVDAGDSQQPAGIDIANPKEGIKE